MTKKEIRLLLRQAKSPRRRCRVYFKNEPYYRHYYPLKVSERLFLGVEEDDFILDGYSIHRMQDIQQAVLCDDLAERVAQNLRLADQIEIPDVAIENWHSVFTSLLDVGDSIIIECGSKDPEDEEYCIGQIDRVLKNKLYFWHFDADGVWQDAPWEIPFSHIRSVTFNSRYVSMLSACVPPCPKEVNTERPEPEPLHLDASAFEAELEQQFRDTFRVHNIPFTQLPECEIFPYFARWLTNFAPDGSDPYRLLELCQPVSGQHGYPWHLFSFEVLDSAAPDHAKALYDSVEKKRCMLLCNISNRLFQLDDATALTAEVLDRFLDVTVTAADFSWTYSKTHEGNLGPYFYRK